MSVPDGVSVKCHCGSQVGAPKEKQLWMQRWTRGLPSCLPLLSWLDDVPQYPNLPQKHTGTMASASPHGRDKSFSCVDRGPHSTPGLREAPSQPRPVLTQCLS